MVNQIIINFGLSDRLLDYIATTYPNAIITERSNTHVVLDVSLLTTSQQNTFKSDIANRLVEIS